MDAFKELLEIITRLRWYEDLSFTMNDLTNAVQVRFEVKASEKIYYKVISITYIALQSEKDRLYFLNELRIMIASCRKLAFPTSEKGE